MADASTLPAVPDRRDYQCIVVDDESAIAENSAAMLNKGGYSVAIALSGEEAIAMARALRPRFILMGIMMPGMNGVDAAMRIVDEQPDCKILFMSGNGDLAPQLVEAAVARGYEFPKILGKPFLAKELLQFVDALYQNRRPAAFL